MERALWCVQTDGAGKMISLIIYMTSLTWCPGAEVYFWLDGTNAELTEYWQTYCTGVPSLVPGQPKGFVYNWEE